MSFEPQHYLIDVKGNDYLPVNRRVQWFRDVHPSGTILTEVIMEQPLTFRATVLVENVTLSVAHASKRQGTYTMESTETAAIGRALALAGFGTQFTDPDEEADPAPVDAPIERKAKEKAGPEPAAAGLGPNVWKRWDALLERARAAGIDVDDVDRGTITLAQLTEAANNLKNLISQEQ